MTQGKRKDQIKFSTQMIVMACIGVLITFSIAIMLYYVFPVNENTESMEETTNIYWDIPNKESDDWSGTTQDTDTLSSDEDVMWIGGNNDTIWE